MDQLVLSLRSSASCGRRRKWNRISSPQRRLPLILALIDLYYKTEIMPEITPIKRHEAIQPLSREHHHGLLLCFRIRVGLQRKIDIVRIKQYVDWFWTNHLIEHFDIEEKYVFPILDEDDEMFIRAHEDHRQLEQLITQDNVDGPTLDNIASVLEAHIRFEERIMFNKIQDVATPEQLNDILAHHDQQIVCDDWKDPFWKREEESQNVECKM